MTKEAADRYSGMYQHWDMVECGWKYNMDNIQAALLLPQLDKINGNWEERKKLYAEYMEQLAEVPGIDYPDVLNNSKSAFHLFTLWFDKNKRDYVLAESGKRGIGVAVNYRAIHLLTYFRDFFGFNRGDFPIAEEIGDRTISIPFWIGMKKSDVRRVIETVRQVLS